jgi:hypothetical protein
MADAMEVLAARTELASRRLREALRVELAWFLGDAVERRLRARPNFLSRTPQRPLAVLRARVDDDADKVCASLDQQVTDLRVYYGAESRTADEEDRGFAKTVREAVVGIANRVLSELAFPGDDKPDRADVTQVDLDAEYKLDYTPSPAVMWAWRVVRELDGVRNALADAKGKSPAPATFELRWHLPELPPAK